MIAGRRLLYSTGGSTLHSWTTVRVGMGVHGRVVQEREDICIHIADLCSCIADISATL